MTILGCRFGPVFFTLYILVYIGLYQAIYPGGAAPWTPRVYPGGSAPRIPAGVRGPAPWGSSRRRAGRPAAGPGWRKGWHDWTGWYSPLTPLENWLRLKGGEAGYSGDFIGHYLLSILYPSGLTRKVQFVLGGVVVGLNMIIYGYILFARKRRGGQL